MSIHIMKQELTDIPNIGSLTMRYENGGFVQVFAVDGLEARVGPQATTEEIRQAFKDAAKEAAKVGN